MILVIHITIAIISLISATYTAAKPSAAALTASYFAIVLTVLSGGSLVLVDQSAILHACASGLTFCLGSLALTGYARRKLATNL